MYGHLKDVFLKIGFIDRRFLSRLPLRASEVKVIGGVCRQIDWYTEQLEKMRGSGGMEGTDPSAGDIKPAGKDQDF